ncbi:MAG: NAD-dependent epimerase/dehydratase family protein, partial [Oscillospiraceae bacterium]|nr:NAD-dependent epimerase/dehydratase family protein [Oscillospiraceae bacterium]
MELYVISGVTGMTGNELVRQLLEKGHRIIGFDNFFASSVDTIKDVIDNPYFDFYEYDINNPEHMEKIRKEVIDKKAGCERLIYINCAAVVHTEHFYHIDRTFE